MAHKVIVPQKKNYVPQFLKQRDINSYLLLILVGHFKQWSYIWDWKEQNTMTCYFTHDKNAPCVLSKYDKETISHSVSLPIFA